MSINKEWDNIHVALDVICSRYGSGIINDPKTFKNLLADFAPESVKEARAFCNTISCERIKRYISCGKEIDAGYLTYCIEEEMIIPNEWAPYVALGILRFTKGKSTDALDKADSIPEALTEEKLAIIKNLRDALNNSINQGIAGIAQGVSAIEYSEGLMITPDVTDGCYVYGIGTCKDIYIKIPPEHKGLPLKRIESCTFNYCRDIKGVKIPPTVQVLGDSVFSDCKNLERVEFPEGIERIPTGTFWYCYKLEKVNIPSSVREICKYAFFDCKSLKSVDIPEGVKIIEESAFYGCEKMERISIPASISVIKANAFGYCNRLKRIDFGGSCSQWKAIDKRARWKTAMMSGKIYCSDGILDF